jgi:hypothetical protein
LITTCCEELALYISAQHRRNADNAILSTHLNLCRLECFEDTALALAIILDYSRGVYEEKEILKILDFCRSGCCGDIATETILHLC